jgi:cytochrome c6
MNRIRWMRALLVTITVSIVLMITVLNQSALAADAASGAKVFNANCAACHMGGGNTINATKTLKKDALTQNGKDSIEAIVAQVTNGKGAMPSFKSRLSAEQIESVAMYVVDKSNKGW